MLDILTLRLSLALVSVVVLALFYLAVYRPTRSPFAAWWCLALMCSAISPVLFLFNGTAAQVVANPAASVISVVGAASVRFATRTLRGLAARPWTAVIAMLVVLIVSVAQNPAENIWSGDGVLFVIMTAFFCAATVSLMKVVRQRAGSYDALHDGQIRGAMIVASLASGLLTVHYATRSVLYLTVGHESELFVTISGTGPTTLVYLVTLVAVTFSVASLGYDSQTQDLRRRIAHDELTGLLSRAAFLEGARRIVDKPAILGDGTVLVIADLDHFKQINDTHGHAVGDHVLSAFGAALDRAVGEGELCGRLGGEEFGVVLRSDSVEQIEARLLRVSRRFAMLSQEREVPMVTVSYGVAEIVAHAPLSTLLARADEAMYSAKEQGRDCVVVSPAEGSPL